MNTEEQGSAPPPSGLSDLGRAFPRIAERFSSRGSLGLIAIDASSLSQIEVDYGEEASRRAMASLGTLIESVVADRLGHDELVVLGETGRFEVLVMLFRSHQSGGFYRYEIPRFVRSLGEAFERHGQRVVYPYSRETPIFGVGYAASVRNPHFGSGTQIRTALEEAREDAGLHARLESRRRRRDLMGLVMAGEITSVYEPIVDVATKTVFGYEALARGPQGTDFHAPLALFHAAENEGMVYELDCLCRKSGLEGAVGLPAGTKLFLNVRPTTIHDPSFQPEALIHTLQECGLAPSDLVFEISEQESIRNFDVFREVRDDYGKLGFQFALDDTGAGYASLQSVIELEPDFIKVDRAFITGIDTDPARQTLLRALHSVADGIGARIIGEGLDTLEELDTIGSLGIPFVQGWLFGKPTPLRA